jgi:hypothetical protein
VFSSIPIDLLYHILLFSTPAITIKGKPLFPLTNAS